MRLRLVLGLLGLCLLMACSHVEPFYASGQVVLEGEEIPQESIMQRLILLGDAGSPNSRAGATLKIAGDLRLDEGETTIVFLGDNLYVYGLAEPEDSDRARGERALNFQLKLFEESGNKAKGIMIPGNHDWNNNSSGGLAAIRREADYVRARFAKHNVQYLPTIPGTPGPVSIDVDGLRVIVIDSQWWLHKGQVLLKNGAGERTDEEILQAFENIRKEILSAGSREVVIVAHHPIYSHGPHGAFFTWQDHFFPLTNVWRSAYLPLPVLGSLYVVTRRFIVRSSQDQFSSLYSSFIAGIQGVLKETAKKKRVLLYAAGHEHSLQVMVDENGVYHGVSGSTSKRTKVGDGPLTRFAHEHRGLMTVDITKDNRIFLRVYEPQDQGKKLLYSKRLR